MNDLLSLGGLIDWDSRTFSLDGAQLTNIGELP